MTQKRRRTCVFLAAGATICIVVIASRAVPKYQLMSRTQVMLGTVIEDYVRSQGTMPRGLNDLESAGMLRKTTYQGKAEWQVTLPGVPPTILFYIDDLSVKWSPPLETAMIRNGCLVDSVSGKPLHIIKSNVWYVRNCDAISTRIYESWQDGRE